VEPMGTRTKIGLIALLMVVMLTGCWSRRELETLDFITAVGLDHAAEEGKIQVTVQMAKPFAITGSVQSSVQEKPFHVMTATGYTVFEAVRNLNSISPRRPFWAHARFIVFGEDMARDGLQEALDFFDRDGEPRRTSYILMAQGVKASDLLQAEFSQEPMPSEGISELLQGTRLAQSTVAAMTVNEFLQALEGEGIDPITVRVELIPLEEDFAIGGDVLRDEVKAKTRMTGSAIFKDDRLVAWMNRPQTRGYLWVTGQVRSGIININEPETADAYVSLEIVGSRGSFKPQLTKDGIKILVQVEVHVNIGEMQQYIDIRKDPGLWVSIERRLTQVVKNEIMAAVTKAQLFGADIFGFGAEINRRHPKEWRRLRENWEEEFKRLTVEVEVKARIKRVGLVINRTPIRK
jgi:spore germination protein KC